MSAVVSGRGERERLCGFAERYLDALVAREPGRLPLSPAVRFTENTRQLPLGSGLWRTVRGRWPGGQCFVDPDRGQVAYWGVVDELRGPSILGVRIKVEGRLITEVETLLVRGGAYFQPELVERPAPGLHDVVAQAERAPRGMLERAAHRYFDAIERSDGDRIPLAPGCVRVVNGVKDSSADRSRLEDGEDHRALDIAEQINAGHFAYIEGLRQRRLPIADVERGLVHCHLLFDHPGDVARPGGEVVFGAPNTMLFFEVFKVKGGKIHQIWAIGSNALPYGIGSGWT
ncbi:MAG: hypothetical protein J2P59_00825 [Acidimicrobiales bacterium]|nr:hypothetical protein [Acidimicrobiales bacterium]